MHKRKINKNLNKNSSKSILDTTKTIYNEESDRFKQVESKSAIAVAFNGALLAGYLSYTIAHENQASDIGYLMYTLFFKLVIFLALIVSVLYLLKSIKSEEYSQAGLDNIVTYDFARKLDSIANMEIAATYKEAIDDNRVKIEEKLKLYNLGVNYMIFSLAVFSIYFIIEEVIKNVI